ncbi:MAG: thiamine phosphate synthase [Terriglobales bacterium]
MLLYYITDRRQFPGDEAARQRLLLDKIGEAADCGVDFIQLREKDLSARELEQLARDAQRAIQETSSVTRLLVNSRTDVALASGATGVHLRSNDISPREVRSIWTGRIPMIGVSCHDSVDVKRAKADGASFCVFGPVFEKNGNAGDRPTGVDLLGHICQQKIPVLALGGITIENARACVDAGAAGIAGIRLFQENNIADVVGQLRD